MICWSFILRLNSTALTRHTWRLGMNFYNQRCGYWKAFKMGCTIFFTCTVTPVSILQSWTPRNRQPSRVLVISLSLRFDITLSQSFRVFSLLKTKIFNISTLEDRLEFIKNVVDPQGLPERLFFTIWQLRKHWITAKLFHTLSSVSLKWSLAVWSSCCLESVLSSEPSICSSSLEVKPGLISVLDCRFTDGVPRPFFYRSRTQWKIEPFVKSEQALFSNPPQNMPHP